MKTILSSGSQRVVLFEEGEDVIAELKSYAQKENIGAGWVNILGASREITLGYYNLQAKSFEKHTFVEDMEIVNVSGNISQMNGEAVIHLHGTFGKRDLSLLGGHIFSLIISASGETLIQIIDGHIEREYDKRTGLNLMSCSIKT